MKNSEVECIVTSGEFKALLRAYSIAKLETQLAKDARDLEKNSAYFLMRARFLFSWQGRLEALEFVLRTLGYYTYNDTEWQGDNDNGDDIEEYYYDE